MPFFLIFLILPFAELAVFGMVSSKIGVWTTLFLCLMTALIGSTLVRQQGLRTLLAMRGALGQGKMPLTEIFDGFCQMAAGAFLITPGFITDTLGFLLLIPSVRNALRHFIKTHTRWEMSAESAAFTQAYTRQDPHIIEGEFEQIDTNERQEGGDKRS